MKKDPSLAVCVCATVVALMPLSARAQTPTPASSKWDRVYIDVAPSGGFIGVRKVELQTQPSLVCAATQPPATAPACTPDTASVLAIKNSSYSFQPAVSVGVVFGYRVHGDATSDDALYVGVGGNAVFVPTSENSTRPAPSITFHAGKKSVGAFAGFVFVPTDDITLPNGATQISVPPGFNTSSLVRTNAGRGPTFYFGIVVGGLPVKSPA